MPKTKSLALILGVLAMSFLLGYLVLAWTEPSVPPPDGNVPPPLNTSINAQSKEGALVLGTNLNPASTTLIIQNGRVGIGTASPGAKLHINTTITTIQNAFWLSYGGVKRLSLLGSGTIIQYASNGTTIKNLLDSAGDSYITAGNLGIGTMTPANKLHVVTNTASDHYQTMFENLNAGQTRVAIKNSGTQAQYEIDVASSGEATIQVGKTGLAGTKLTQYAGTHALMGGNVGIGETSPQQKLFVSGNARATTLQVGINTNAANYLSITHNDNYAAISTSKVSGTGDIVFQPAGNVGIGTASPGAKLDVQGGDAKVGIVTIKGDGSMSTNLNAQRLGGYTVQDIFSLISPVGAFCSGETLYGTVRGTIPGIAVKWIGQVIYSPDRTYTYLWSGDGGLSGSGSAGHGGEPVSIEKAYSTGGMKTATFTVTDDLGVVKAINCQFKIYDNFKYVFKTSEGYGSNLGGLSGADAKCQNLAISASRPGTYKAWLSTVADGTSPKTRFIHSTVPYFTTRGEMIAYDWTDLTDGTLFSPINVDENGVTRPYGAILTATKENGEAFILVFCISEFDASFSSGQQDCLGWTYNGGDAGGIVGNPSSINRNWSAIREYGYAPEAPSCPYCSWLGSYDGSSLYCFQQ